MYGQFMQFYKAFSENSDLVEKMLVFYKAKTALKGYLHNDAAQSQTS